MFERSAKSSYQLSDKSLHPFVLQTSLSRTYELFLKEIKTLNPDKIIEDRDYWELYYTKNNIEYTYYFVDEKNGNTRVVTLLYTPNKRGKAKKLLRALIAAHKETYASYLAKYSTYRPEVNQ